MKISDLFVDGVIVAVHVGEWRARLGMKPGDIKVDWSADVERAMYLGAHRLSNAEAFEAVHAAAAKAHRAVDSRSQSFPLIPASRYMAASKLDACAIELAEAKREFDLAVANFCDPGTFAAMRSEQLAVIEGALAKLLKPGLVEGGSAAFERTMGRIRAGYPAVEDVRPQFSLTWQVFSLQSASSATVEALSGEAEQVRGLLGGMMAELRGEVRDKLESILAIVAKGGKLNKRSIESAVAVLDRVDELNVWGDDLLRAQSLRLRAILESVNSARDASGELSAVVGLRDVAEVLSRDVAESVKAAEESISGLGRRKLVA